MASVTLAESAKLAQDELVAGVIENVITVDRFFDVLPFDGIDGNALAYNRENALGDVQNTTVGTTITAKNPATFSQITSSLTTILGDAEVNGLIQATRSAKNDQTSVQIGSKAKNVGRQYRNHLINGTGASNQFTGLINLCAGGQTIASTGANGDAFGLPKLDQLIDLVVDKDGEVDYIQMHSRTVRSFKAALRALGGASIMETVELPSGKRLPSYSGIPIFRNDYIPTNQTRGTTTTCTSMFAGTLDDGSREHGIAGLTARNASGIMVEDVGVAESKDERIWRVKWYCGLALFSEKGLAMATGITN